MVDNGKTADRGGNHGTEQAKANSGRIADLVKPMATPHGQQTGPAEVKTASLASFLGLCPPGEPIHHPLEEKEQEKKTWTQRIDEQRGNTGGSTGGGGQEQEKKGWAQREDERQEKKGGGGSDQNWEERLRSLPEEQKQDRENERER